MKIRYNVTGPERKRLANCIGEFLGCEARYMKVPTCAYKVGYITVDKTGAVIWEGHESLDEEVRALISELEEQGFKSPRGLPEAETEKEEPSGFTVSLPADAANVENLEKLLAAKGELIKKALDVGSLPVRTDGEKIYFPWFDELPDADTARACTHLIEKLCRMSREQSRVQATAKEVTNEKYEFRCFLLRLGFIGEEYKADRKILLKNLSGDASFKNGRKEAEHAVSE